MFYYLVTFIVKKKSPDYLSTMKVIVPAASLQGAMSLIKHLQKREEYENFIFYNIKYMRISLEKAYELSMDGNVATYSDLIHGK